MPLHMKFTFYTSGNFNFQYLVKNSSSNFNFIDLFTHAYVFRKGIYKRLRLLIPFRFFFASLSLQNGKLIKLTDIALQTQEAISSYLRLRLPSWHQCCRNGSHVLWKWIHRKPLPSQLQVVVLVMKLSNSLASKQGRWKSLKFKHYL